MGGDFREGVKSTGLWDLLGYSYRKAMEFTDNQARMALEKCKASESCMAEHPYISDTLLRNPITKQVYTDGGTISVDRYGNYLPSDPRGSDWLARLFNLRGMNSQYDPSGHSYSSGIMSMGGYSQAFINITSKVHDAMNGVLGYHATGGWIDRGLTVNTAFEVYSFAGMVPAAAYSAVAYTSYVGGSVPYASVRYSLDAH